MTEHRDTTDLLTAWRAGDEHARSQLFERVYANLHSVARGLLRIDRQRHVFQATELVNECAIRMLGLKRLDWRDRAHFIAIASTTMRRILVDEARRRGANKRDVQETSYVTGHVGERDNFEVDIEALDQALDRLHELDPKLSRVVELKFFGGLTNEEVAEVESSSVSSITRRWRTARAWLFSELADQ